MYDHFYAVLLQAIYFTAVNCFLIAFIILLKFPQPEGFENDFIILTHIEYLTRLLRIFNK